MDQIAVQVLPILLAVTLHEYAHGWVARRLGDRTAEQHGRLTINPIAHVDLVGTVLFPALQLLFPPHRIYFGWAKPVPVNPANFRDPRKGMAFVAIGGPAANLIQLFIAGGLVHLFLAIEPSILQNINGVPQTTMERIFIPLTLMCVYAVQINAVLMAFNLIPIPPLDGSRILFAILPVEMAKRYALIERYGMFIIFGLLIFAPGVISFFVQPVLRLSLIVVGLG